MNDFTRLDLLRPVDEITTQGWEIPPEPEDPERFWVGLIGAGALLMLASGVTLLGLGFWLLG